MIDKKLFRDILNATGYKMSVISRLVGLSDSYLSICFRKGNLPKTEKGQKNLDERFVWMLTSKVAENDRKIKELKLNSDKLLSIAARIKGGSNNV